MIKINLERLFIVTQYNATAYTSIINTILNFIIQELILTYTHARQTNTASLSIIFHRRVRYDKKKINHFKINTSIVIIHIHNKIKFYDYSHTPQKSYRQ